MYTKLLIIVLLCFALVQAKTVDLDLTQEELAFIGDHPDIVLETTE